MAHGPADRGCNPYAKSKFYGIFFHALRATGVTGRGSFGVHVVLAGHSHKELPADFQVIWLTPG